MLSIKMTWRISYNELSLSNSNGRRFRKNYGGISHSINKNNYKGFKTTGEAFVIQLIIEVLCVYRDKLIAE
ncbi:unnamed protein product [Hermetia illucens]|uniref:Uncharacterized protein n=1 Tax=Hermetia illucens TaxID=343691 RepID=A0A7R8YT80_HERIL|nr:unnamed protein product [Hermetia illucens]